MKHPVTNDGATNLHCGETVIRPGETRMIDEHLVPPGLRPEPLDADAPAPVDPIAALAAKKSADVIAALPDLTLFDLDELDGYEQASTKPRKSVLEAIIAEKLQREPADTKDGE